MVPISTTCCISPILAVDNSSALLVSITEQLCLENRRDLNDVRLDNPAYQPALCDEQSERCCAKYGICSHEVLRDGKPDPDSPIVRKVFCITLVGVKWIIMIDFLLFDY